MILSCLAVVSFTIADAFQPGRAFIARTQQQQQHHSTLTTLWSTKANATTADPSSFGVPTSTLSLNLLHIATSPPSNPTNNLFRASLRSECRIEMMEVLPARKSILLELVANQMLRELVRPCVSRCRVLALKRSSVRFYIINHFKPQRKFD